MKKGIKLGVGILVGFALSTSSAKACEPVLPFIKVVGGPWLLTQSWLALLAVVLGKCFIFAWSQRELPRSQAFALMFAGNIVTTVVGALVAVSIGSYAIILLLIVWPLCLVPARRVLKAVTHGWLTRFTPGSLATSMCLALLASCFLFTISTAFMDLPSRTAYWLCKLAAIYPALIVSIVLSAFWEEWTVWKLSGRSPEFTGFVRPVVHANLVALLCVMLFAAGVALPKRLRSPDFLISLFHQSAHLLVKN